MPLTGGPVNNKRGGRHWTSHKQKKTDMRLYKDILTSKVENKENGTESINAKQIQAKGRRPRDKEELRVGPN